MTLTLKNNSKRPIYINKRFYVNKEDSSKEKREVYFILTSSSGGKLPYKTESVTYDLEYGQDTIEIHTDAIKPGQNVLLIDDLLATGGTALAAAQLIEKLKGKISECAFIVDLPEIGGRKKLEQAGYKIFTLVEFEGK